MARRPLVAGNWKMNGDNDLVNVFERTFSNHNVSGVDVVVCPPSCYLSVFNKPNFALAGQDVSEHESGAHTGDLSAKMLVDVGCKYAIVGHSERREDHGENSALVASKAKQLLNNGLIPIICVGEPLEVREAQQEASFVAKQLEPVFNLLSSEELSRSVIAYEPVWAIGTGKTASPEQAQAMHLFIRQQVASKNESVAAAIQLLYGGSVKPENAQELFAQDDIDGGLIGGASLKADSFLAICQAAG